MAKVPVAAIGAGKKISWSCQFDCILFPRTIFNFKFIYIYIYILPLPTIELKKKKSRKIIYIFWIFGIQKRIQPSAPSSIYL